MDKDGNNYKFVLTSVKNGDTVTLPSSDPKVSPSHIGGAVLYVSTSGGKLFSAVSGSETVELDLTDSAGNMELSAKWTGANSN